MYPTTSKSLSCRIILLLSLSLPSLLSTPHHHVTAQNQFNDMPCTAATLLQQTVTLGTIIESNLVTIPFNGLSRMRELMFSLESTHTRISPIITINDLQQDNTTLTYSYRNMNRAMEI